MAKVYARFMLSTEIIIVIDCEGNDWKTTLQITVIQI